MFWHKYRYSVIVGTWNHVPIVGDTLKLIAECLSVPSEKGGELIIVDIRNEDGDKDHARSGNTSDYMMWADKYAMVSHSTGCGGGWNIGAQLAEGKYLVFVDDKCLLDAKVNPIEYLVESMEHHADIGMVGVNGGYRKVERDRSYWFAKANDHTDVDEVSGYFWGTPYHVFAQVGGLDIRLRPGGHEETDYAFKVRNAGYKVRRLDSSGVTHEFGISGRDTDIQWLTTRERSITDVDPRNKAIFKDKWSGFPSEGEKVGCQWQRIQ